MQQQGEPSWEKLVSIRLESRGHPSNRGYFLLPRFSPLVYCNFLASFILNISEKKKQRSTFPLRRKKRIVEFAVSTFANSIRFVISSLKEERRIISVLHSVEFRIRPSYFERKKKEEEEEEEIKGKRDPPHDISSSPRSGISRESTICDPTLKER